MSLSSSIRIGLQPDHHSGESFADLWALALQKRGVEVVWLDLWKEDALAQAAACDGIMWRWSHHPTEKQFARPLLHLIEHYLGKPVFPNQRTAWFYDNKIWEAQLLDHLCAPQPEYWTFWREEEAMRWAQNAPYPLVFKLAAGAGSSAVVKVETAAYAQLLIRRAFRYGIFPDRVPGGLPEPRKWWQRAKTFLWRQQFLPAYALTGQYPPLVSAFWQPEKNSVFFQRFLPGNDYDTRVVTVGDRIFAFRRVNRPGDFRASGSGLIEYDPDKIDRRVLEIANKVSQDGGFQCMSYDFIYDADRPVITEISYAFLNSGPSNALGHFTANAHLTWVPGQMNISEAQVEAFLAEVTAHKAEAAALG